jgi:uncharacterized protein (DUF1778 family)
MIDPNPSFDYRLPVDVKPLVERAAALCGQTLNEFAVSTLAGNALRILNQHQVTVLSNRDRDILLGILESDQAIPCDALVVATQSYKEWLKLNEHEDAPMADRTT